MLDGMTVQVKTSVMPMLVFNAERLFSSDVAILVQYVGEDRQKAAKDPRFRIWGWVGRKEFLASYYTRNFGYGTRLVMDSSSLHPLDSLIEGN
jgi:hypothetical protein